MKTELFEKLWKEEDPRMLREQLRVYDNAFQILHEVAAKLRTANKQLREANRAANALLGAQAQENDKINSQLCEALRVCEESIRNEKKEKLEWMSAEALLYTRVVYLK